MKKPLQALGVLGLLAWTLTGFVLWKVVGDRVHVTIAEGESAKGDERLLLLDDRLGALDADLRTLAHSLGENFEILAARVEDEGESRATRTAGDLRSLREAIATLGAGSVGPFDPELARRLDRLDAVLARLPEGAGALPVDALAGGDEASSPADVAPLESSTPQIESGAAVPPDEAPATQRKKSFLAFTLPSDDFAFDQPRRYVLLPSLSRVGFDAKSTLHDFTGVSTAVSGEIEANLSQPADAVGFVRVPAESLSTGLDDRDAAMLEHLSAGEAPVIEFQLGSFEPDAIDIPGQSLQGLAKGDMTIRGTTRRVAMPIRLHVDESRRLVIEGKMPVRLTDYAVPVPSKLGVISMEDEVEVWIALRARSAPVGSN